MDFIISSVNLNPIGSLIYNVLFGWINGWASGSEVIGSFAVTVIFFTLFLKLITLPLDIWSKQMGRKNAKKMEIMQPELDKIKKQCGDDKQALMVKQRELNKKYKYSMLGGCLPQIITMVIFFMVFGGFNSAVRYHNNWVFEQLRDTYEYHHALVLEEEAYKLEMEAEDLSSLPIEEQIRIGNAAISAAEQAVSVRFEELRQGFLLTHNIFMPDNWSNRVPEAGTFYGTGMGRLGIPMPEDGDGFPEYNRVMDALLTEQNTGWNGYLVLPAFALALAFISSKFMKPPAPPQMLGQSEQQAKASKSQQKMMQYMMPIMMGVFPLFWSAAFALYIVTNSLLTTVFGFAYNMITKKIDAKEKDHILATTVKK